MHIYVYMKLNIRNIFYSFWERLHCVLFNFSLSFSLALSLSLFLSIYI